MNYGQIKTRVNDIANDSIDDGISSRWINDVYHTIERVRQWDWLLSSVTWASTGAQSYVLSASPISITDFSRAMKIRDNTSNINYVPASYRERDRMASDLSFEYAVSPDNLTIYLYPDTSGNTYELHYFKTITELSSDTDSPIFPSKFHEAIIYGVAEKYFERHNSFAEANRMSSKFRFLLNEMEGYDDRKTEEDIVRMRSITEAYSRDFKST
jgi:hypothetical protein